MRVSSTSQTTHQARQIIATHPKPRSPGAPRPAAPPPRRAVSRAVGDAAETLRPSSSAQFPFVILPGFGNCTEDYVAPFGNVDAAIASALQRRGHSAHVLPVERKDWFKVGGMLFSRGYWTGSCSTKEGYNWYLERVKETVDSTKKETGAEQVILLGHSAGGWLGRAFIGETQWRRQESSSEEEPHESVAALVTLGTPHKPPPRELGKDMTGGALSYVNNLWPGAHFSSSGVAYVAVGSKAVRGDKNVARGRIQRYAYNAYKEVAGDGELLGDAVVPLDAALLDGAVHVVLDDILHSMSRIGTFNEGAEDSVRWYGSDSVVDVWLEVVREELQRKAVLQTFNSVQK